MMDQPCTFEAMRGCLNSIESVNRLTRAYHPTLHWLNHVYHVMRRQPNPLHIVDVGCGGGDMLRQVARWASELNLPVVLTGIDLNPNAIRAARESTIPGTVTFLIGRAQDYQPPPASTSSSARFSPITSKTPPSSTSSTGWSPSPASAGSSTISIAIASPTSDFVSSLASVAGIPSSNTMAPSPSFAASAATTGSGYAEPPRYPKIPTASSSTAPRVYAWRVFAKVASNKFHTPGG